MTVERVLFVCQGFSPYADSPQETRMIRELPKSIQEKGVDARVVLPQCGTVSEKKNLLYEVIRLSGQNLGISNKERILSVKVPPAPILHMQAYFIYNEHYFGRGRLLADEAGKLFSDNDERAIFYARGVFETMQKLRWAPDLIHCHGWISCLVPLFLKKVYADNPFFANTKVIYSVYADHAKKTLSRRFVKRLSEAGIPLEDAERYNEINYETALKLAVDYADAVMISDENVSKGVQEYVANSKKPFLRHYKHKYGDRYWKLYESIFGE